MDKVTETDLPTSEPPQAEDAPHWPAVMSFLTTWCMPATSAERTQHVTLRKAFAVHVLCGLAVVFLICIFVAIAETTGSFWQCTLVGVSSIMDDIASDFERHPTVSVSVTGASVIGIELGFLALALLIMPWGARDEPLRKSFANALRRVWLHTTHVLVVVFLVGTVATSLSRMETAWETSYDVPPPEMPSPPPDTVARGSQEWKDWAEAGQVYSGQYWEWLWERHRKKPWYMTHLEFIIAHSCAWSALWLVWALLRAVGAPRRVAPIERPPTCEACGYNLLTIAMESRCPECGEPVLLSLGPDARVGVPWERRREMGVVAAWWRCCVDPVVRPGTFGRHIRVTSHVTDHRRFLLLHLPVMFAISAAGTLVFAWIVTKGFAGSMEAEFVPFIMTIPVFCGGVTVLLGLALPLLATLVVGLWWYYRENKRNLLAGAMQVACYLAGYFTLWVVFTWLVFGAAGLMSEAGIFDAMERFTGIDDDFLAWLTWFVPNVVCLVFYVWLVARGTAGLRYANK